MSGVVGGSPEATAVGGHSPWGCHCKGVGALCGSKQGMVGWDLSSGKMRWALWETGTSTASDRTQHDTGFPRKES